MQQLNYSEKSPELLYVVLFRKSSNLGVLEMFCAMLQHVSILVSLQSKVKRGSFVILCQAKQVASAEKRQIQRQKAFVPPVEDKPAKKSGKTKGVIILHLLASRKAICSNVYQFLY